MTTTIDLKPFCDKDKLHLQEPFSYGEWTYATDGKIGIRVPRMSDVPENPQAPAASLKGLFAPCVGAKYEALPEAIPANVKRTCTQCNGSGKVTTCPKCKGEGQIECDECGHESDCKNCKTKGVLVGGLEVCANCEGEGVWEEGVSLSVGNKLVSSLYLLMIAALPNPQISPTITHWNEAMPFIFEGGEGIVMPMSV